MENVWESYKKRMEYVWNPGVITDIRIIPNTKPLSVTIFRDNDDSNFEVITEFK